MEELRSTDILDKEIQFDARKKAEKILKKADSDCAEILASVNVNIDKARTEKENFFSAKLEAYEKDQKASIPLEKQRFEVSFIQSAVLSKISKYISGLPEEKCIEVAAKSFDFNTDKKMNAYVYGFKLDDAKKFLTKKLGKNLLDCQETIFRKMALEEDYGLDMPKGIILESEDKTFRCRLTLSEVIGQLLDKNRAELSEALFGGNS